nr:occlusion derived viral protein-e27 [Calliteara abietis nucleopolyhedrovirus]
MKKYKCSPSPKIRTVTEVITSKEKLKRDYDLAEFDAKNINSLESYNNLKTFLALTKYMAMLNTLKLTQPLLTIFRDRNAQREISTIILATLGFVHNRVNPLVNNFDGRMEFEIVENRELIFPGEPIVFRQNETDDFVCLIDRISIMKMLERQYDMNVCGDQMVRQNNTIQMMKLFTKAGRKRRHSDGYEQAYENDIKLSEAEANRYLNLLIVVEHAYLHYCIFKNYGALNYANSMLNHKQFSNKTRPTASSSYGNLMLSKFKFVVENYDSDKKTLGILSLKTS